MSHAVATRWYRAPELLFGARKYQQSVDTWACGCVIAELLTLSPLLPGDTDIDQLLKVTQLMGSPTAARWPGVESLPDYGKIELPSDVPPMSLRSVMPSTSDEAILILSRMLRYDGMTRASPRSLLGADWTRRSSCTRPLTAPELVSPRSTSEAAACAATDAGTVQRQSRAQALAKSLAFPRACETRQRLLRVRLAV